MSPEGKVRGSPIRHGDCSSGDWHTVFQIMAVRWDRMGAGRTVSTPGSFLLAAISAWGP